jgi:uncharacterized protein (TIGR03083 family)
LPGPGEVVAEVTGEATVSEADVKAAIVGERRDLVEILGGLSKDQWDSATLCKGWRVREVVAHITDPYRYSTRQFLLEMLKSRGKYNAMADRIARRDAGRLSSAELVEVLRTNVETDWKPPGGGFVGALSHDVIHGLDITVGLGLDRKVPLDRVELVLGSVQPRQIKFFGVDVEGLHLHADDLDWGYGSGRLMTGSAQDLLLVLCGRKLPAGSLSGAPSARFTAA